MYNSGYPAIYDFGLFPYALGDILTWNVQSAIRAIDLDREHVDIHICLDPRRPSCFYQRKQISEHNYQLFFQGCFPAFHTQPMLRHLKIFNDAESMLRETGRYGIESAEIRSDLDSYRNAARPGASKSEAADYFFRSIHSHRQLNDWYRKNRYLPLLEAPAQCAGDIENLSRTIFRGKRLVGVQFRLRQLDLWLGHKHGGRDADFLEWYTFLSRAVTEHPDVHFILLGRLQEKPLAALRLPNVSSLRTLGMNLGHELALLTRCALFLGSSSGFAAMANFTEIPYSITRLNEAAREAYAISPGETRLPFAVDGQNLVFEEESADLMMRLLEDGLVHSDRGTPLTDTPQIPATPSSPEFVNDQQNPGLQGSSTHGYFTERDRSDSRLAPVLKEQLDEVIDLIDRQQWTEAREALRRTEQVFPRESIFNVRFRLLSARVMKSENRHKDALAHSAWAAILDPAAVRNFPDASGEAFHDSI